MNGEIREHKVDHPKRPVRTSVLGVEGAEGKREFTNEDVIAQNEHDVEVVTTEAFEEITSLKYSIDYMHVDSED